MIELSKAAKKTARIIIEKGLQKEFENGLNQFDKILQSWKAENRDNGETYHALYKSVETFDKHIGRRYDGMGGSDYLYIIAGQLFDDVISESDIEPLPQDAKNAILLLANMNP
jgi:hypothetical protein